MLPESRFLYKVVEWANDGEDSDDELTMKIEEKGRRMLSNILIKYDIYKCERIVKLRPCQQDCQSWRQIILKCSFWGKRSKLDRFKFKFYQ